MSGKRIYNLNEDCFNELTPETAYWIGFIAADGCIRINNTHSFTTLLCLSSVDDTHIEKWRDFMMSNQPLWYSKKRPVSSLTVSSKIIFEDLQKWGIKERKTYEDCSHIRHIPDKYKGYFITGLFDGDGSWIIRNKDVKDKKYGRTYNYRLCTVSILSNTNTLKDICDYLVSLGMKYPKICKTKSKYVFTARWYSKKDIDIFYNMYKKSPITLDRKLKKIDEFLLLRDKFVDKRKRI